MKTFLYFIIFICTCCCLPAKAQQARLPPVTGDFKDVPVDSFLIQLEAQTHYHFYYDTAQLGVVRVNIAVTNQPLNTALDKAFSNTNIYFAIDKNNVFISKGLVVQTTLPQGFFTGKTSSKDALATNLPDVAYDTAKGKNNTAENKLIIVGENTGNNTNRVTIAGYIKDAKTGEPVIGASVQDGESKAARPPTSTVIFCLHYPKAGIRWCCKALICAILNGKFCCRAMVK